MRLRASSPLPNWQFLIAQKAFTGALVLSSAAAAEPGTTTDHVNMRNGPGTQYSIIMIIPRDASVEVLGCEGWCRVTYAGTQGYVFGDYIETVANSLIAAPQQAPTAGDTSEENVESLAPTSRAEVGQQVRIAEDGIDALLRLGDMYRTGEAAGIDSVKAFDFYRQAAEVGSMTGKLRVGDMLIRGEGVAQNIEAGSELIREVAAEGDVSALLLVGDLAAGGHGGSIDASTAVEAYEKAASLGGVQALMRLGDLYRDGIIVPADNSAAVEMYERAAARGETHGLVQLGNLFYEGEGIAFNAARAFQYFRRAADAGSETAKLQVAEMIARGHGVAQDVDRGRSIITELAATNDESALVALGDAYSQGDAGPVDPAKAIAAYEGAASLGRTQAMMRLGDLYCSGVLVRMDCKRGLTYYQAAADAGDAYAVYAIGTGYLEDRFQGAGSPAEGIKLLQEAEQRGVPDAVVAISDSFLHGNAQKQDTQQAVQILRDAVENGNGTAAKHLVALYRDGRRDGLTSLIKKNLPLARSYLQEVKHSLRFDEVELEEILLKISSSSGGANNSLYDYASSLSPRKRAELFRDISRTHPNAYVFVLQKQLQKLGLYNDQVTGFLNSATAKALNRFCVEKEAAGTCRFGPMSGPAAGIFSLTF